MLINILFIFLIIIKEIKSNPIVYGTQSHSFINYPFLVYLKIYSPNIYEGELVEFLNRCTGSIISSNTVMTAAHCLTGPLTDISITVVVGSFNISNEYEGLNYYMENYVVHDDFNITGDFEHDISLFWITDKFPINSENSVVKPAVLATTTDNIVGKVGIVAGWGVTELCVRSSILKEINMQIIPNADCQPPVMNRPVVDTKLCAINFNLKSTTCRGDSGSPLIVQGKIVGIVSYGVLRVTVEFSNNTKSTYCSGEKPKIFTNIAKHLQWINENLENKS